jgi:8-oxo-dGTP pyrophosphatase MutT (NUDIX family)
MQKKNKEKILYSTDSFNLLEREGAVGIKPTFMNVVVMPFTCDDDKLPLLIGVIEEKNPFRSGGVNVSLVTGTSDEDDPDLLSTAKRELHEETGLNVEDTDRWYYLGTSTSSKFVDHEQPCFAVDVTGIEKETPETDGSEGERKMRFKFIPANDVVKAQDIFIPGLFLKLFKFVMGMEVTNPDEKGALKKGKKGYDFNL